MLFRNSRQRLTISIQTITDSLTIQPTSTISGTTIKTTIPENCRSPIRSQNYKRLKLVRTKNSKIKIFKIGQNSIIIRNMVRNTRFKISTHIKGQTILNSQLTNLKIRLKPTSSTGKTRSRDQRTLRIHLRSRVTAEFFQKTTKSKSKLSFASNGWQINLAPTATPAPSLMEIMSSRRRSMSPRDTRPSSAANFWRRQGVPTEIDVNSSTPSK